MSSIASLLTGEQLAALERLGASLDRDAALWASGYLAGLAGTSGSAATLPAGTSQNGQEQRTVTVLVGSETGNCTAVANDLAERALDLGVQVKVTDMAEYKPRALKDERDLLLVVSTHGEGDPPQTGLDFFEFLESRKAPKLEGLRYAVLALGDSTYEHFCAAGKIVDERLAALGAERLADRVDCDVDYEDAAAEWMNAVLDTLAASASAGATTAVPTAVNGFPAPTTFDKRNPFEAPILENLVLTGRGSTKETRHIEFSLEGSGLAYRPGDALGIVPRNDPAVVEELLDRTSLPADARVHVKKEELRLDEALAGSLEITAATPRFIDQWAGLSGADELAALTPAEASAERAEFLRTHHVIDIVDAFPVPGVSADEFVAGLRPLQPRLYSLASSLEATPEEAHLTVSTVRYTLHDLPRTGVASGHLAGLTGEGATVPVYVQPNESFHLPEDDAPVLMIGAGTGVAPYRAFMQEREARGISSPSWLVFGERNFRSDFLYQLEWQEMLKRGVLGRLDLAFSRDGSAKTYVQDRLLAAGRDVYEWLEDGAVIYVCGDASSMAPDVHRALARIVSEHGAKDGDAAEEYLLQLKRDRRYRLDTY